MRAIMKRTHGMSGTPIYCMWKNMRQRCKNKKHAAYFWYGKKGISVCDRWEKFENFLEDMGERPEGMSIDRVDSNSDYKPSNCLWATRKQQEVRKGMRADNTSGYRGVSWCKRAKKWKPYIMAFGSSHGLGSFNSPEEASVAYEKVRSRLTDNYELTLGSHATLRG